MSDRDGVVVAADQDFADDEPQDALLAGGVELVQTVSEAAEEPFEGVGELEVGLGVVQLGVDAVELRLECRLALAQRGRVRAELVERDQLFLVGLDQPLNRLVGADEIALERFAATSGGVLGPCCGEAAVDLILDEFGVLEQPADLGPDERVDLVGADGAAAAPLAVGMPPAVLADAAVVGDPLVARAGAGPVAGVAALAAHEHALQQRQLFGVALGEVRVVDQAGLRERERLLGDERRDRDQRPLLGRLVGAGEPAAVPLATLAGGARRAAVPLGGLGLPERGQPAVGGVAQHRPDRRSVPTHLAGAGRDPTVGQPARELADRDAIAHVAVEHLAHDLRLRLVDLPVALHVLGLLDVPVAVRRAGHHRLRAAASAVQLPAPGPLRDLRTLVLGDHPLELAQQLILRGAAPLGLLREADLNAGASELFQQQHLIGIAAREAIRRVAQQHLERPLRSAVAQPLKRRTGQRRARESLVLEHQVLGDQQPARRGELTQPDGLALDRLVLALALGGHPRVDRRHPARPPVHLRVHFAHRHSDRWQSLGAARAPRTRTPAPAARRPAGQTRTRSRRAVPSCS